MGAFKPVKFPTKKSCLDHGLDLDGGRLYYNLLFDVSSLVGLVQIVFRFEEHLP